MISVDLNRLYGNSKNRRLMITTIWGRLRKMLINTVRIPISYQLSSLTIHRDDCTRKCTLHTRPINISLHDTLTPHKRDQPCIHWKYILKGSPRSLDSANHLNFPKTNHFALLNFVTKSKGFKYVCVKVLWRLKRCCHKYLMNVFLVSDSLFSACFLYFWGLHIF